MRQLNVLASCTLRRVSFGDILPPPPPPPSDSVAPFINNFVVDDTVSPIAITMDITENTSSTVDLVYVLVNSGDVAPTKVEVLAQTGNSGSAPVASGVFSGLVPDSGVSVLSPVPNGIEGIFDMYVVPVDQSGNEGEVSYALGLDIDTLAPAVTIDSVIAGDGSLNVNLSTDTAEGNVTVTVTPAGSSTPVVFTSPLIPVSSSGSQSTVAATGLSNDVAYDVTVDHSDAAVDLNTGTATSGPHTPVAAPQGSENRVRFDDADSALLFGSPEWFTGGMLCFVSMHRPVATNWSNVFHTSTSNSRGITTWNDSDQLQFAVQASNNTEYSTGYVSPPDWTGTGRISLLAAIDASTGDLVVWSKVDNNTWKFFGSDSKAADRNPHISAFSVGGRTDMSTGSFAGNDLYRLAVWELTPPDVSDPTVQAQFMAGDITADTAIATTEYGTPHIDLNGVAQDYADGTHDGSWGVLTSLGQFSNV